MGSCSIFSPCGVELTILLEENVLPDEPLATSKALVIECDIVFAKILLLEESEFTLIPVQLLDVNTLPVLSCGIRLTTLRII